MVLKPPAEEEELGCVLLILDVETTVGNFDVAECFFRFRLLRKLGCVLLMLDVETVGNFDVAECFFRFCLLSFSLSIFFLALFVHLS